MSLALEQHLFAPGPKRILALDGGGVKGIITIAFLEKIEEILRERSGRGNDFRLSDYFDLVGGTSVGSLLATLIALGYPVSEIKSMFNAWTPQIFRHPWPAIPLLSPRFSSRGLKRRARKLLGEHTLEDADLRTGLAIITKRVDTGSPWVLTNNPRAKYWNDPADGSYLGNRHYRIADLVCASTAAPYYFAPKRIRMVARASRPKIEPGLFVDGGVSPFNNPALMLLMLAGIKGYGFHWHLGANHLFMVSVGTGSYRMPVRPNFLMRHIPGYFAATAIHGLAADSDMLSLTLLQWLSAPKRPWEINSEIGTMQGELLGPADQNADPKPLLAFVRYDTRLEVPWLTTTIGARLRQTINERFIEGLKQLDRPEMMEQMYRVGSLAAADQVTPDDFLQRFDPQPDAAGRRGESTNAQRSLPPFTIETRGVLRRKRRLIARRPLTAADFRAIAVKLGITPIKARRIGLLAARQATAAEKVETWSNGKESRDTAAPGDWIVTNLSPQGRVLRDRAGHANIYIVRGERFSSLYDRHEGDTEFGAVYKPKGTVEALYCPAGYELVAPWGEMQQGQEGYLLLNDTEVYGNNRATFDATYEIVR
jgi:patatin-like phospholipase